MTQEQGNSTATPGEITTGVKESSEVSVDLQGIVDGLESKLIEKDNMIQSIKSAQQGVDKANVELRTELDELRDSLKQKMSSSEQKEYEQVKLQAENDKLNARIDEIEKKESERALRDVKLQILRDNNLNDLELIDLLKGGTIDEFSTSVQAFKSRTSKIEQTVKTDMVNGKAPAKGNDILPGIKEMSRSAFDSLDDYSKLKSMQEGTIIND